MCDIANSHCTESPATSYDHVNRMMGLVIIHKNLILTGQVDNYCLICDCLLCGESASFSHITKAIHKKNLSKIVALPKYEGEKIVKVKNGYYCMFCNVLLKTITKVSIHVLDDNHKSQNKCPWLLSRVKGKIIAFDEVEITDDAWHGLVENTCTVCNTDFDLIEEHKADKNHVVELIKSKCIFGENFIYRMVDEDAIFCVICVTVFGVNEQSNHHNSEQHINNYNKGKKDLKGIDTPEQKSELKIKETDDKPELSQNIVTAEPNKICDNVTNDVVSNIATLEDKKQESPIRLNKESDAQQLIDEVYGRGVEINSESKSKDTTASTIALQSLTNAKENVDPNANPSVKVDVKTTVLTNKQSKTFDNSKVEDLKQKDTSNQDAIYLVQIPSHNEKSKISKIKALEYEKKDVVLNLDMETAQCKKCNEHLDFSCSYIEKHIEDCETIMQKLREEALGPELVLLCEENYIKIAHSKITCKFCKIDIEPKLEEIKAHVNEFVHKDNVLTKTGFGPVSKMGAKEFIETIVGVDTSLRTELIINGAFVLSLKSFHTVIDGGRTMYCAMCQQDLWHRNGDAFTQHINKSEHKKLLVSCNFVTSMTNEIIREIRPNVYHCGYCNTSVAGWPVAAAHVRSPAHQATRRHALWAIERTRPALKTAKPLPIQDLLQITFI